MQPGTLAVPEHEGAPGTVAEANAGLAPMLCVPNANDELLLENMLFPAAE
jgi:hypothetical protein